MADDHVTAKGCASNCDSCSNSSLPPRPSSKKGIFDFFRKVLENRSRYQTRNESSLLDAEKIHGDDNASDHSHRHTSLHNKALDSSENSSSKRSLQSDPNPSGLENLGNTCYLNAILQCLRSTEVVRNYCNSFESVTRKRPKCNGDLFPAFAYLIMKMQSVSDASIGSSSILKFKNAFTKFVPYYTGNLQQDAFEFFTYLLDALHDEIKESSQTPISNDPIPLRSTSASLIPSKYSRRHRLRIGGLKYSESSIQLVSTDGVDPDFHTASGNTSDQGKPSFRKLSRFYRFKSINRVNGVHCDETLHDTCQPALSSAETTAAEKSFLKDTFVGHLQTQLRCLKCINVTTRDELFWNLALCVPEVSSLDKEGQNEAQRNASSTSSAGSSPIIDIGLSLDDCLQAFTKTEILDGLDKPFCTNCKTHTKARLRVMISKLPKILVLQFQRFESTCCKTKKRHLIKFDFVHDMAPYCTESFADESFTRPLVKVSTLPKFTDCEAIQQALDASTPTIKSSSTCRLDATTSTIISTNYRLYAVVYHHGGTQRGHYTARCRLVSDSWFLFDDDNVSRITDVNDVIQPTAYILFYERIDEEHSPCH